jgi:hypothetical protein
LDPDNGWKSLSDIGGNAMLKVLLKGVAVAEASAKTKKKGKTKKDRKFDKVMDEFDRGVLHSSTGQLVTKRSQAIAIAASEAGISYNKAMMPSEIQMFLKAMADSPMTAPTPSSYALSEAVDSIIQARMCLTAAEIAQRIETLKEALAPMPDGEEKALLFKKLDELKRVRSFKEDMIYPYKNLIRSLLETAWPKSITNITH